MRFSGVFSSALSIAICGTVLVLSGCADAPRKAESAQSAEAPAVQTLHSLRLSDTPDSAPAKPARSSASSRKPAAASATSRLADKTPPVVEIPVQTPLPEPIDLTCDTDDLFQRIRNGFAMPDINNDLVLYHQQWYLNRPDYLRRMVERSSLYLFHIVNELEKRGMPMELALLPMVESAYNPMAYSRAKASGLWQFIPSTGKRYNLDQDWWQDERRDIVASTAAALDYLQSIYDMHGDWHLALASYNWGEGAVGRAISKNVAQGLPTDYQSLNMPGETKNYVPKLQALKNIFSNRAMVAELGLPTIPNQPYFSTVTKTANIDVTVAAKLAEMPVHEFVALNPSHNRPVIKSETPLVIPADKVETFISNVEAHESSNKPLSMWQTYVMRMGDRLDKIAAKFGISLAKLKEVNGIFGKAKAKPGLPLLVPDKSGANANTIAAAESATIVSPAAVAEAPATPRTETASETAKAASHTVRRGETLPVIAKRYGLSVAELKRLNHLRSDKIAAGRRLTVSQPDTKIAKADAPASKSGKAAKAGKNDQRDKAGAQAKTDKKTPKVVRYTVRRGDTLASIARQFKVDKDDLARWNRVSPNALKPGKTLTIQVAQSS